MSNSEFAVKSHERPDVLFIEPDTQAFVGTILRDVVPGTANALAMFSASATVNRVQALPGFTGAAFMVSAADDMLFELVRWQSDASLAAARGDHRYADHVAIVEDHSKALYEGFSSLVSVSASFTLGRGETVAASLVQAPGKAPEQVFALLNLGGPPAPDVLRHVVPIQEGAAVLTLSKIGRLSLHALSGPESWRGEFRVVEGVSAAPRSIAAPVKYRLLRQMKDGQSAGSAAADA